MSVEQIVNTAWFLLACWLLYYGTGSAAAVFGVLILVGLAVRAND